MVPVLGAFGPPGAQAEGKGSQVLKGGLTRAAVATCLLVTSFAVGSASAAGAEDPELQEFAAARIAEKHGMTVGEARRRLEFQDRATPVGQRIQELLGSDFAGIWYDHADDGRLKIAVPDSVSPDVPARIQATLERSGIEQSTDLVGVRWRWSDLQAKLAWTNRQLQAPLEAGRIETSLSPQAANAVIVEMTADATDADRTAVEEIARTSSAVRVHTTSRGAHRKEPATCGTSSLDRLVCSSPIRGGVAIASGTRLCTAGFDVRGAGANQYPFVLTAGHCLAQGGSAWNTWTHPAITSSVFGSRWSWQWGGGGDYGIVRNTNTGTWAQCSCVIVVSSFETTSNHRYQITGNAAGIGWTGHAVCTTSAVRMTNGYHSDCGIVLSEGHTVGSVPYLTAASLCVVPGSSGGPIYKSGIAFGITVAQNTTTSCLGYYQDVELALIGSNTRVW